MTSEPSDSESDNSGSRGTKAEEYRNITPGRLSDVLTVLALIDKHDGEITQQTVICETGWSAAKASTVIDYTEGLDLVVKHEFRGENHLFRPATAPSEVQRLARKVAEEDHS